MPELNGLEAARRIRGLDREDAGQVPIIAMTANAYEDDIRASLECGMNAHLAKPFQPQELYETLEKWVRQTGA
jgi:CheY-like chemotaxis protein